MNALIIDGRNRKLQTFVASVTKAQDDNPYQLVLRHALDIGHIQDVLNPTEQDVYLGGGETKRLKRFTTEMPVIIMGEYTAHSSAGHVAIHSADSWDESRDGHRKVLIVGGLGPNFGKKGLRVLGLPITATLVRGPVEIEELAGSGNSNCASADAAWAGVKLLASTDRKAVFLVEGQSDYTYVVRLRSSAEDGVTTEFPVEHRSEMFSRENIVKRMVFSFAYHSLVRGRRDDRDYTPSEYEVHSAAKRNMESYLSAKSAGEERYWEWLGRGFGSINMSDDVIAKMAEELGVSIAPVETATAWL